MSFDKNSILHIQLSNYAFSIDENTLCLRLRTKKNNVNKVYVNYGDTAYPSEFVKFTKLELTKILTDNLFDYYEIEIQNCCHRVVYYFEIIDLENLTHYYYSDNFYKSISGCRNDLYKFPYIRREDVGAPPKWLRSARLYNIFPDSFKITDSDKYENKIINYEGHEIKNKIGGTIRDIINKIDYISDLGFNGIYLNPIFLAGEYHKYDAISYTEIDPLFGSKEDFLELVNKSHEKGMKVVIDLVFNHCGWHFFAFDDVFKNQEKSKYVNWFYGLKFPVYRPKTMNETPPYETFGYERLMPKLNTDNDEVIEYFIKVVNYLIDEFNIDGFRLDTSDEVNDYFWIKLNRTIKNKNKDIALIGEIWQNPEHWLNSLMFDSSMNYCLRKSVLDLFNENLNKDDFNEQITKALMKNKKNYTYSLLNILSTHDTPRIFSLLNEDEDKFKLAYSFMYTFEGAISVLYGEEEPISGITESDYRKCIKFENKSRFADFFKIMNKIRDENLALICGNFQMVETKNSHLYTYKRSLNDQTVYVSINLSEEKNIMEDVNVANILYSNNYNEFDNSLGRYGVVIFYGSND